MKMKKDPLAIEKITIYKLDIPLKKPFVISLGPIYNANNIIVIIETTNGMIGTGECSPFMTINGESQQTCFEVGQYLAKGLKGKVADDVKENHAVMDKIIYGNTSIKSAFDIAMYDIAAQSAGLPLYKFLGGKKNKKIITDYTISIGTPDEMAAHALELKKEGFKVIKVKLGKDGKLDVERMKAIRSAIGKRVALRIDANQGWGVQEAINALRGMKDLEIQYCEEPIPRWAFTELKEVRKKSPVKIMADESCFDEHDAKRLIGMKACDMFNLKLGKSSGLYRALKIIRLAEEAGMEMQVGGFMESRIAMTVNAHLALASRNIKYYDFDTPLMFQSDPVEGGMVYGANGEITISEAPGIGATVKADELKLMKKKVV